MSVFQNTSISQFLDLYIQRLPKKGRGEISRIAEYLGVSTTLVSQIRTGVKTFTPEQTLKLIEYLGYSGIEADYLTYLVQSERAGTRELKKYWKAKLEEVRKQSIKLANRLPSDRIFSESEKTTFYSNPIYTSVRLWTTTADEGRSLEEIMERFGLTRVRAQEILRFLIETGLCVEKNGLYSMGIQKTHLEFGSPHLLRHHSNWRIRSIRNSEELTPQELMYTAPVSLSREDFDLLREEMAQFIQSFLKRVHASPAEEIACLNLDFFWIKK